MPRVTEGSARNVDFHDLRRECASRWLDSGAVPLSTIQAWLGHANIAQTSTYLQTQLVGQNDVMRRFEEAQAALQQIATKAGKGGNKRAQTAAMREHRVSSSVRRHEVQ